MTEILPLLAVVVNVVSPAGAETTLPWLGAGTLTDMVWADAMVAQDAAMAHLSARGLRVPKHAGVCEQVMGKLEWPSMR